MFRRRKWPTPALDVHHRYAAMRRRARDATNGFKFVWTYALDGSLVRQRVELPGKQLSLVGD